MLREAQGLPKLPTLKEERAAKKTMRIASEGGFTTESETEFPKQRKRTEANPPHLRPAAKRAKHDNFTDDPISNDEDGGVTQLLQTYEHKPSNPAAMLETFHYRNSSTRIPRRCLKKIEWIGGYLAAL